MKISTPKFPQRIEIELSSSCNLLCSYCPREYLGRLSGFMDVQLFKRIIDEASPHPQTILVLHRRGESMLHPLFNEILGYVRGKFQKVQLATNATLLDKDKFESIVGTITFLSFSIDAPSLFDRTRIPARYKEVEEKILRFLDFNKRRVKTQVSMVRREDTHEEDIQTFKNIWRDKVDRIRIYEEHSIDGVFGALRNPRQERKPCVMPNYEVLVYYNGKVGRCNHDWNGQPMGDLNVSTINDIWNSRCYQELRKQHQTLEINDGVCKHCDSWYPEIGMQGTGDIEE